MKKYVIMYPQYNGIVKPQNKDIEVRKNALVGVIDLVMV